MDQRAFEFVTPDQPWTIETGLVYGSQPSYGDPLWSRTTLLRGLLI